MLVIPAPLEMEELEELLMAFGIMEADDAPESIPSGISMKQTPQILLKISAKFISIIFT